MNLELEKVDLYANRIVFLFVETVRLRVDLAVLFNEGLSDPGSITPSPILTLDDLTLVNLYSLSYPDVNLLFLLSSITDFNYTCEVFPLLFPIGVTTPELHGLAFFNLSKSL